jgi:hypothetical protein
MPTNYTVVQGDCLSSIAAAQGFRDWHTIYNDPANADFRDLRPDPNAILPGDVLVIPDKTTSSFRAATGQAVSYTVKSSPQTSLCVRFDDAGDLNYTVQVDGADPTPTALLAAGDTLQVPIPPAAAQAQLLVWPASYDSADDAGDAAISWTLSLGNLDPIETVSGIQARLKNLGYDPGAIDGVNGPNTEAAVKQFQQDNELKNDGICGPITTKALKTAYGM